MDSHLQRAFDAIEQATAGLTATQIGRPQPGRWSIAEILEHLRLAYAVNAAALERIVASGQPKARRPGAMQWIARTLVIDAGYFPRVRAPEATTPAPGLAPEGIVAATLEALQALETALAKAAGRFGEDVPVLNHPYFARLSVRQWRRFHWRHTVHHMKQVQERRPGS